MKKTNTLIVLLLGALLLTVSCKKDDVAAAVAGGTSGGTGGGTTVVTKDLFSNSWSVSNNAWAFNYGLGNFTGSPFNSVVTYSFNGTCNCTTTMNGSQTSGSFEQDCSVGIQVSTQPTTSTCNTLDYVAGGTYTNTGGILTFCRSGSSNCTLIYH